MFRQTREEVLPIYGKTVANAGNLVICVKHGKYLTRRQVQKAREDVFGVISGGKT